MLLSLVVVLVHALAAAQALTHPGDDIGALCARKSVDLTTFSQLKQLGKTVGTSSCPDSLKDAVTQLIVLIESGKDDLCSEDAIGALRAYYSKYLDTSGPVDANREPLPESLKRFVLAYGMQMSHRCKRNMVRVLMDKSFIYMMDFISLEMVLKDNGPIAQILGEISDPGRIVLPGDLARLLNKRVDHAPDDKLNVQTSTSYYIKKFQTTCQERFKPLYEPLILPLVRLVNMGFDYKYEPSGYLDAGSIAHQINQWSRAVFLCETLANVRIVASQADAEEKDGGSLVRILTSAEADAIDGPRESPKSVFQVAPYVPEQKVVLGDQIYDKSDRQLHKAVKSFETGHGEEYFLTKQIKKKGLALIKKQLKGGHFGVVLSAAWKGWLRRRSDQPTVDSSTKEFVEGLNDLVEAQKNGPKVAPTRPGLSESEIDAISRVIAFVITAAVFVGLLAAFGVIG